MSDYRALLSLLEEKSSSGRYYIMEDELNHVMGAFCMMNDCGNFETFSIHVDFPDADLYICSDDHDNVLFRAVVNGLIKTVYSAEYIRDMRIGWRATSEDDRDHGLHGVIEVATDPWSWGLEVPIWHCKLYMEFTYYDDPYSHILDLGVL